MSDLSQFHYAGFWRRFAAQFIDGILFIIPNYLLFYMFERELFIGNIVYLLLFSTYYIGFISGKWQATIGKRLMSLRVVTKQGEKPTVMRVVARFFVFLFPGFPVLIPSLYFLHLTPKEQADLVNAQGFQYKIELVTTFYALLATMLIGVAVLFLIWYLPVFFTKEKKSIVDIICGTRVVKGNANSPKE